MSAASLAWLLIAPLNSSLFGAHNCLSNSFYGTYGGYNVFQPENSCLQSIPSYPTVSYTPKENYRLVWIEQVAVGDSLKGSLRDGLDKFLTRLSAHESNGQVSVSQVRDGTQSILTVPGSHETIYRTNNSLLLSLPADSVPILDTLLPPFYKPLTFPRTATPVLPVPSTAIDLVKRIISKLKFNPTVASIASNISVAQMRNDIRWLTGEDSRSPIISRHSFTSGAWVAAEWLKERFEESGAMCELRPFLTSFSPNVVWYVTPEHLYVHVSYSPLHIQAVTRHHPTLLL
jgi:hypothetical protein